MRRAALTLSDIVMPEHLACSLSNGGARAVSLPSATTSFHQRFRCQIDAIEGDAVIAALDQAGGNKAKAARLLGIDYKTYRLKLKIAGGGQMAPANGGM
jgi:DNA-binding NtrC family response regulator